jgi:hypothetical protein
LLDGIDTEQGLAHFRSKIDGEIAEGNTFPAEVYINLLVKIGRLTEALAAARKYLGGVSEENLSCPGVSELARKVGDYSAFVEAARVKGDAVNFLAGMIAGERGA